MKTTVPRHDIQLCEKEKETTVTDQTSPLEQEKIFVHTATTDAESRGPSVTLIPIESETKYPKGPKLALISLALCLGVFLVALDNSIIATAIPKITDQFHSLDDVGWYGSAYLLATASLQLLFGKVYTFFSIKWVFLVAIGLFELGSLICGVANGSLALIMGRAIAGIGSAGIFSGSLIVLAHSVALEKRPVYTGLVGSMYGIASVAGPLLGGVFTDKVTWRWCFYINIPIGAFIIVVIAAFFTAPDQQIKGMPCAERIKKFDPLGTFLFLPAIICLLLALQWGGTTYAWNSWRIIMLFCFFAVLILLFVVVQYMQQDYATVPPRILSRRTVWSSALFSFCFGAAFLCSIYFLPIWFQAVKGATAVKSGIMNLPMLLGCVILAVLSGISVTFIGYYTPFMLLGAALLSIGYGLMSMFNPDTHSPTWIGYQVIAGVGAGFGAQQSTIAVQVVLDIDDVPTGTAIVVFAQTLGGALFVSIGNNVFRNKLVEYLARYASNLDPVLIVTTGTTDVQSVIDKANLPGLLLAYNDAICQTFLACAAVASISVIGAGFVEWRSVKGKNIAAGDIA